MHYNSAVFTINWAFCFTENLADGFRFDFYLNKIMQELNDGVFKLKHLVSIFNYSKHKACSNGKKVGCLIEQKFFEAEMLELWVLSEPCKTLLQNNVETEINEGC